MTTMSLESEDAEDFRDAASLRDRATEKDGVAQPLAYDQGTWEYATVVGPELKIEHLDDSLLVTAS